MTWTAAMFTPIMDEVLAILPVLIPVALGLFSIGIALKYAKRVFKMFL
jgi:hypothetical protein